MTSREEEKRKQFTYNRGLLENLDKLIGYVETSEEDLLSAMNTLLDAYRSEFEQNQLLQADVMRLKQENVSLESARNQVQADLLELRNQYHTELMRQQEQVNASDKTVQVANNLKPELDHAEEKKSMTLLKSNNLKHIGKETRVVVQSEGTQMRLSLPRATSSHCSTATSVTMVTPPQTANHHQVTPKRSRSFNKKSHQHQHQFEPVKNRIRIIKCALCKRSILPLSQYYQCFGCQLVVDWACHSKNIVSPCANNTNRFKLSQLITSGDVPPILIQCYELIEKKGSESRELYQENGEEISQETNRVISKYLATTSTTEASSRLSKLNVRSLCAIVLKVLNQLDEPLITRRLWTDFVRASGQYGKW